MMTGDPGSGSTRIDDAVVLALFERLPDVEAKESIVAQSQPLAEYLARRFAGRGEPLDELIQVANIGLLGAIDRFDPSRGVLFSTYAAATMVGELKRHFRDKGWTIRVPRRLQELGLRINRLLPTISQDLGDRPRSPSWRHASRWTRRTSSRRWKRRRRTRRPRWMPPSTRTAGPR